MPYQGSGFGRLVSRYSGVREGHRRSRCSACARGCTSKTALSRWGPQSCKQAAIGISASPSKTKREVVSDIADKTEHTMQRCGQDRQK